MWPGQQSPGGEQDPQEDFHNPYRQPPQPPLPPLPPLPPGAEPSGEQPPTVPVYPVGGPYGMPQQPQQQPPSGKRSRTAVIAVCAAATVVLAAATYTGVVLLGDDGKKNDRADDGKNPSPSASAPASPSGSAAPSTSGSASASASPSSAVPPTIPGWKAVVNPEHGTAFDVPADWEVAPPTVFSGFSDDADPDKILIGHTAPAFYKSKWCSLDGNGDGQIDDYKLAATGTKGADGAKDTNEVALKMAPSWVYGAYTQPDKTIVKWDSPVEYTTKAGIKGSYVKARSEGAKKPNKCAGDGRAIVFGFKNVKGDFVAWDLYGRTGVPGAVSDDLMMKIMSTVRLAPLAPADPPPSSSSSPSSSPSP
ncbi:hypothetical protein OHS33_02905 [Streptomyces sp. NBC_00536]|uniref:hypothetical protein n=1 Tax=Streptomyces sp. NBC_00536 TaxID=2975769 RepID=UPI002E8234DB|nr:hypothetical protein [Streptomyces sp. NBC_00536]WUC77390.1 hypothetical protein OHS33_02905 [Streptomyces sp. NBC_00536]